jgi:hypothetical protein
MRLLYRTNQLGYLLTPSGCTDGEKLTENGHQGQLFWTQAVWYGNGCCKEQGSRVIEIKEVDFLEEDDSTQTVHRLDWHLYRIRGESAKSTPRLRQYAVLQESASKLGEYCGILRYGLVLHDLKRLITLKREKDDRESIHFHIGLGLQTLRTRQLDTWEAREEYFGECTREGVTFTERHNIKHLDKELSDFNARSTWLDSRIERDYMQTCLKEEALHAWLETSLSEQRFVGPGAVSDEGSSVPNSPINDEMVDLSPVVEVMDQPLHKEIEQNHSHKMRNDHPCLESESEAKARSQSKMQFMQKIVARKLMSTNNLQCVADESLSQNELPSASKSDISDASDSVAHTVSVDDHEDYERENLQDCYTQPPNNGNSSLHERLLSNLELPRFEHAPNLVSSRENETIFESRDDQAFYIEDTESRQAESPTLEIEQLQKQSPLIAFSNRNQSLRMKDVAERAADLKNDCRLNEANVPSIEKRNILEFWREKATKNSIPGPTLSKSPTESKAFNMKFRRLQENNKMALRSQGEVPQPLAPIVMKHDNDLRLPDSDSDMSCLVEFEEHEQGYEIKTPTEDDEESTVNQSCLLTYPQQSGELEEEVDGDNLLADPPTLWRATQVKSFFESLSIESLASCLSPVGPRDTWPLDRQPLLCTTMEDSWLGIGDGVAPEGTVVSEQNDSLLDTPSCSSIDFEDASDAVKFFAELERDSAAELFLKQLEEEERLYTSRLMHADRSVELDLSASLDDMSIDVESEISFWKEYARGMSVGPETQ